MKGSEAVGLYPALTDTEITLLLIPLRVDLSTWPSVSTEQI